MTKKFIATINTTVHFNKDPNMKLRINNPFHAFIGDVVINRYYAKNKEEALCKAKIALLSNLNFLDVNNIKIEEILSDS